MGGRGVTTLDNAAEGFIGDTDVELGSTIPVDPGIPNVQKGEDSPPSLVLNRRCAVARHGHPIILSICNPGSHHSKLPYLLNRKTAKTMTA